MSILFLTLGRETVPSSRVRVYQFLPHLREKGIHCKVLSCGSKVATILALSRFLIFASFYDIVIVQKVLLPLSYQKVLSFLNRSIVFDFDDAIYTYDFLFSDMEKRRVIKIYRPRLEGMLRLSGLVTLANEETAAYASSACKNILRVTGPIDTDRYLPRNPKITQNARVIVGWIGSFSTTPYVEKMLLCFEKLLKKFSHVEVRLIGARRFNTKDVPIRFVNWSLSTEVPELEEFDIGIMPLPDNKWTRGKGGYKLLQYMAMGIPAVASPVGINKELIKEGLNGFLASSEEEWLDKLSLLIEDKDLRERIGERGRQIAERDYSFYHYIPLFIRKLREISESH